MGVTGSMAAILNEAILPEPGPVARGDARLRPRRAVRQHRARLQLGPRHPDGHGHRPITPSPRPASRSTSAAEKFFDIKCRSAGLNPSAVVIVATIRALKMHGGVALDALTTPDPAAVEQGLDNLAAHLDAPRNFGKPTRRRDQPVREPTRPRSWRSSTSYCEARGVSRARRPTSSAQGGAGAIELAEKVVDGGVGPETPLYARSIRSTGRSRRRSSGSPGRCTAPTA